jgi:hypothetical protein
MMETNGYNTTRAFHFSIHSQRFYAVFRPLHRWPTHDLTAPVVWPTLRKAYAVGL